MRADHRPASAQRLSPPAARKTLPLSQRIKSLDPVNPPRPPPLPLHEPDTRRVFYAARAVPASAAIPKRRGEVTARPRTHTAETLISPRRFVVAALSSPRVGVTPPKRTVVPRLPLRQLDDCRAAPLTARDPRVNGRHPPDKPRAAQQHPAFRPIPHKRVLAAGDMTARSLAATPVARLPQIPRKNTDTRSNRSELTHKIDSSGRDDTQSDLPPSDTTLSATQSPTDDPSPLRCPKEPFSIHSFDTVAMIGQGGYAVVRVAKGKTGKVYALKQVAKADFTNVQQLRMAYTEVEIFLARERLAGRSSYVCRDTSDRRQHIRYLVGRLGSSFFPEFHGCWQDEHFIFFLMEYLPGGDLMKHLIDREIFPERVAKFYTAQIALAIGYMHDHLHYVHRDIKPDNVLFDVSGHTKLVDFGLSRRLPPTKYDAKGKPIFTEAFSSAVGTPDYMAPEVHRPGVSHDRSIDWWSLGIILYEMLFGGPPLSDLQHRADVTSQLIRNWKSFLTAWPQKPAVSDLAKDLLNQLIAEKEDRLQTVEAVLSHPWFDDLNLDALRTMEAPIIPNTQGACDVRNFDTFLMSRLTQWEERKRRHQPPPDVAAFLLEAQFKAPRVMRNDTSLLIPFVPSRPRRPVTACPSPPRRGAENIRPLNLQTSRNTARSNDITKSDTADAARMSLSARQMPPTRYATDATRFNKDVRPGFSTSRPSTSDAARSWRTIQQIKSARDSPRRQQPTGDVTTRSAASFVSFVRQVRPSEEVQRTSQGGITSTVSSGTDRRLAMSSLSSGSSCKQRAVEVQATTLAPPPQPVSSNILSGLKQAVTKWLSSSSSVSSMSAASSSSTTGRSGPKKLNSAGVQCD